MKKAFTLFEFIITLILFTLIAGLLSKPLFEFHRFNSTVLNTYDTLLQTHLTLLKIEKWIQNCIRMDFTNHTFKCLLKDEIISLKDNKLELINSAIILENNHTFYSPYSNLQAQLQNRKDLYKDNENFLYAFKNGKIKKISPLQNNTLSTDFTGVFIPLQAEFILSLDKHTLNYELKPQFNKNFNQKGIFAQNVSLFLIQNNKLKICLKEKKEYCLEKRLIL